MDTSLNTQERDLLKQADTRISPLDIMGAEDPGHYFHVGLSAVRCVDDVVAAANAEQIERVLDFPCGYGRVLRFLVRRFSNAAFTAGDLDGAAVRFCASTFGAAALYSRTDFCSLKIDGDFDLIWCGSLFTHIDATRALDLLRLFEQALAQRGILVFTTAGDCVADRMRSRFRYGLSKTDVARLLADYSATGFGYANYPGQDKYGQSLMSAEWVRLQLARVGGLREVYHGEKAWDGHHDVFGFLREDSNREG